MSDATAMNWKEWLLERPIVYRTFHRLFSDKKQEQLRRYLERMQCDLPIRVLDLGCGPGTNAPLFLDTVRFAYFGIDLNPDYIEAAARRYGLSFRCADITKSPEFLGQYDLVLINSVLHHLTDNEARTLLESACNTLRPGGECVVLDMIQPRRRSLRTLCQRTLIRLDRGFFCRSLEALEKLLSAYFRPIEIHAFSIDFLGITLWDLRLFVCRR
jgi:SAM-dependent methyltransferase